METLDLTDAYFTISVAKESRKFLRFSFENDIYEFTCVPFGLCLASYVFTKLMKPSMQYLRLDDIITVNYLDDVFIVEESMIVCKNNINKVSDYLQSLGFVINKENSQLIPSKICKFLGFHINSSKMIIELPEKKAKNLKKYSRIQAEKTCKIRDFSRLIGILVSSCPAVRYCLLYTRAFEREKFIALKKSQGDFDKFMPLSTKLQFDFLWSVNNISVKNDPIRSNSFVLEIFSDASRSGWGAACNDQKIHGWWSNEQRKHHINYLELTAVFYGLKTFAKDNNNCEILLRIDNATAIAFVNKMGGIQYPHLHDLAKNIWQWCESRQLFVFASYISSKGNTIADKESIIRSIGTEWELGDKYFRRIIKNCQSPEIDLFASINNAKCKKYISWQKDPNTVAVDAFTVSWS